MPEPLSSLRFRLSSIEPLEVDEELMDVARRAEDRIAHHFHLPLQSGSASVLRRMKRPYSPEDYLAVVEALAGRFPDAALGADVIVGFPGESEAEFEETLTFIADHPVDLSARLQLQRQGRDGRFRDGAQSSSRRHP